MAPRMMTYSRLRRKFSAPAEEEAPIKRRRVSGDAPTSEASQTVQDDEESEAIPISNPAAVEASPTISSSGLSPSPSSAFRDPTTCHNVADPPSSHPRFYPYLPASPTIPPPQSLPKSILCGLFRRPASFLKRKLTAKAATNSQDSSSNDASTTEKPAAPAKKQQRLTQLVLDFGGKNQRKCKECGMEYTPSNPEDAALHKKFHKTNVDGVDLGKPFIKALSDKHKMGGASDGAIIAAVTRKDPVALRNKAKEVLDVVNKELGSAPITDEELWGQVCIGEDDPATKSDRHKVYLYIQGSNCIGALLAQRITEAHRVIAEAPPANGEEGRGGKAPTTNQELVPDPIANALGALESSDALRGRELSDIPELDENSEEYDYEWDDPNDPEERAMVEELHRMAERDRVRDAEQAAEAARQRNRYPIVTEYPKDAEEAYRVIVASFRAITDRTNADRISEANRRALSAESSFKEQSDVTEVPKDPAAAYRKLLPSYPSSTAATSSFRRRQLSDIPEVDEDPAAEYKMLVPSFPACTATQTPVSMRSRISSVRNSEEASTTPKDTPSSDPEASSIQTSSLQPPIPSAPSAVSLSCYSEALSITQTPTLQPAIPSAPSAVSLSCYSQASSSTITIKPEPEASSAPSSTSETIRPEHSASSSSSSDHLYSAPSASTIPSSGSLATSMPSDYSNSNYSTANSTTLTIPSLATNTPDLHLTSAVQSTGNSINFPIPSENPTTYPYQSFESILTIDPTPSPAYLGISRVWTAKSHRCRNIATALTQTASKTFFLGQPVPKDSIAFSQPTSLGRKLATKFFCAPHGWKVYSDWDLASVESSGSWVKPLKWGRSPYRHRNPLRRAWENSDLRAYMDENDNVNTSSEDLVGHCNDGVVLWEPTPVFGYPIGCTTIYPDTDYMFG